MPAPQSTPLANQVLSKESQVILSTQDFADQRTDRVVKIMGN